MISNRPDGLIQPFKNRHQDFLKDESRTTGTAESISFPECEADVQDIIHILSKQRTPITVQGSRTGLYGGAVPTGGHVMNLSRLKKVVGLACDPKGQFSLRAQPGLSLGELDRLLEGRCFESAGWDSSSLDAFEVLRRRGRQFWPPDPSEKSASIGGIAANNSRGICGFHYGPVYDHIKSLRFVDGRGEIWTLARGQYTFSPKESALILPSGEKICLERSYRQATSSPSRSMDLMALVLGSEGTLGVITELTLLLQPFPQEVLGIVFFFQDTSRAAEFIDTIGQKQNMTAGTYMAAVEFMDHTTLECIRSYRQKNPNLREIPEWRTSFFAAVCLEIHSDSASDTESVAEGLLSAAAQHGSDPDDSWAFSGLIELERMRRFRHAAPESVLHQIDEARQNDPRIAWIGVDCSFDRKSLPSVLDMYTQDLEDWGLKAAIFGHAGDGLLHVNLLPQDGKQFDKGQTLVESWAQKASDLGGNLVTEHGIGKTRTYLLQALPLPERIQMMHALKHHLDPNGVMNPGNMRC